MGVIIGASLLSVLSTKYLRLPLVVGLLVSGLLIGPYGFNLIQSLDMVNSLAELGIVLLLFIIGLELDPSKLRSLGGRSSVFVVCEITVSFATVFIVGGILGMRWIDTFILASLISISSTAIIAKTLVDERRLESLSSQLIISVLILEDFFVVLILVLMPSIITATGLPLFSLGITALKALILLSIIVLLNRYIVHHIVDRVSQYYFEIEESGFLTALGLGFVMAILAAYLGLSPGIGAFLMGLLIKGKRARFVRERVGPLKDLFIILFFISMGMLMDFSILKLDISLLLVVAVTLLGKFSGCLIGSRLVRMQREAMKISFTMMPRGEFSFVIARTGVVLGALSATFYSYAGVIVLATSLAGPILARTKT